MRRIAILLTLLIAVSGPAHASLTFAGATDRVAHGSNASMDGLTAFTIIVWYYPTNITQGRAVIVKGTAGPNQLLIKNEVATSGNIYFHRLRATTNDIYITNNTPVTVSTWNCLAISYDSAGSAGEHVNILRGTLTTSLVEATYATPTEGTGAITSDAADTWYVGNNSNSDAVTLGQIAFVGIWNRVLSASEMQSQQFRPRVTSGNVLFVHYGFNGTGTQADWSGNLNNGTVTGATQAAHVPLNSPFALGRPTSILEQLAGE